MFLFPSNFPYSSPKLPAAWKTEGQELDGPPDAIQHGAVDFRRRTLFWSLPLLVFGRAAEAAQLKPATVAAFDRYVRLTEARLDSGASFLWVDADHAAGTRETLRRGTLFIEPIETRDGNRSIAVPDGLIHHWMGATFAKGASVDRALALLQDYDHHADIYTPHVARSRLLARDQDRFTVLLRFYQKKVITVVINSEHDARFTRPAGDRAEGRIRSTRVAEVADPGTPTEAEKPVGQDGGYLWRLNTYWRLLQADGGTYIQCESVTLTRAIPTGFGWLVRPFVTSIPRESLTFTLETTRGVLTRRA